VADGQADALHRGEAVTGPLALSVVLPAYNEGDSIVPVLDGLARFLPPETVEVMVVVDSDEDTTIAPVRAFAARDPRFRTLLNRRGRGVLNAMRAGIESSTGSHVLVTMADGSDDPRDIPPMWQRAAAGADVVAASRYMRGGRQLGGPLFKRTLSRCAGLSLHWLAGLPVHDPTSNFKLYSRRLLDAVEVESRAGFELALELTAKAFRLGLRLDEVPTTWRDRTAGQSNFRFRAWLPHYLRWYLYALEGRFILRPGR
jgi:dolichol-phosphate mannosyltransferase